jgi:regulator of sigma E protease
MITLLATVFVLSVLVFMHELGHFLTAKFFKIRVDRFSMGYPPRLIGKKLGETDYCISAIPFGGYVKIAGMVDESMDAKQLESPPQPWEFRSKPRFQRFVVVAAGSIMNLALAVVIFTTAAWIQGVSKPLGTTVLGQVIEARPAAKAGLKTGDRIVRVDGKEISTWDQLTAVVHSSANKSLRFEWKRGDSLLSAFITPLPEKIDIRGDLREVGLIGIWPQTEIEKVGFIRSIGIGSTNCYYLAKLVLNSVIHLITGKESVKSLAGPVFIAKMAGESAKSGFGALIEFMALLSLNLGILNLLPFPVLDGGHILILFIESVIRRELPLKAKMIVQQAGMVLLVGLMLVAVYNDVLRIVKH